MTTKETDMTAAPSVPLRRRRRALAAPLVALIASLSLALAAAPATAATEAPGWTLDSFATPSNFSTGRTSDCLAAVATSREAHEVFGHCDSYQITAIDAGSQPTDGSAIELADALPPGTTAQMVSLFWWGPTPKEFGLQGQDLGRFFCSTATVSCSVPLTLKPDDKLVMYVFVTVDPSASGLLSNAATVSGGGAPQVQSTTTNEISPAAPGFGPVAFDSNITAGDGTPDTQAGDHPYELTTQIDLASGLVGGTAPDSEHLRSVEDLKDAVVDLPLGLLGSATATPTCTLAQLSTSASCPPDTAVGHITTFPLIVGSVDSPIFNLVPEHGVAAEFGFRDTVKGSHVFYARVVPGPEGYVLQATAPDAPQLALTNVIATFYGDPAARDESSSPPLALFTMPSSCDGRPLTTTLHIDSWVHPASWNADGTPDLADPSWKSISSSSPPVTGCEKLRFQGSLSLQPDTTVADSPAGVNVDIKVPQSEDPGTLATPPLKKAVVTLPPDFTVNPASADGLGACSPAQIALASAAPPSCPDSSKVGSVELTTPLLPGTLTGSIYLATQHDNPFGSLIAGYIVVDDPTTGVVIKVPGNLTPDPGTGQITAVFDNNPQFPFSELRLHFMGGSRGVLATPESCGTFTSSSAFSPWSFPDSGPALLLSDAFAIDSGCVSGFQPTLTAGVQNPQAGAFSPFIASLSRSDTDQNLSGLTVALPAGLTARLAGVQQCSEQQLASISEQPGSGAAQAASPSCPPGSRVGTVLSGAGVGPNPFFLSGNVYLTGPYKGAPYGLAVVVPALAGPFDLGTVVVRQALYIDPLSARVTDVSDPFPTILDGIPLRLRRVDVTFDRPGFTLNPTSCEPALIKATAASTSGATAALSSRFQVGGCRELAFSPRFEASVTGKTSKANGVGLTTTVTYPRGSLGTQADIARVKVSLPRQLPSRLTTLQKACLAATFEASPASCPPQSVVGHASVTTPLLSEPLAGPAYFVSHGNEAFPDLTIILHGAGITIELVGTTFISKAGITSTTFKATPDVPFERFTLTLPQGPFSALAANTSLCGATKLERRPVRLKRHGGVVHVLRAVKRRFPLKLLMPTEFTAQNGAQIKQNTRIAVSGCPAAHRPGARHHKLSRPRTQ
jgi:hypothetical protein